MYGIYQWNWNATEKVQKFDETFDTIEAAVARIPNVLFWEWDEGHDAADVFAGNDIGADYKVYAIEKVNA